MNLLLSSLIIGLIFSLLALGVYISFRIFHFPDITADGSFTFGAAVTVSLLLMDWSPLVATTGGFIAGMGAGFTTGLLHTKFRINGLLSGILVMTALYSINLRVMGRSNVPLSDRETLATQSLALLQGITGNVNEFTVARRNHGNCFVFVLTNRLGDGHACCWRQPPDDPSFGRE